MVITHKIPVASPNSSITLPPISEQYTILRQLRHQLLLHYRPLLQQGAGPIRVMARMVAELQRQCRELNIAEEVMQTEIVNRTIGDVNVRLIIECEGEPGGPGDYRMLAEELGVALPNEKLRAFYRLRRQRFIAQLQRINEEQHVFERIFIDDDATVYNWSKLRPGEDAFSLFEKTGIAGVPGSGFGYTNDYVRFSIGVIPVPEAP